MVDQGDLLVGAVVSVAIANDYIKAVCGITVRQRVSCQTDRMEPRAPFNGDGMFTDAK